MKRKRAPDEETMALIQPLQEAQDDLPNMIQGYLADTLLHEGSHAAIHQELIDAIGRGELDPNEYQRAHERGAYALQNPGGREAEAEAHRMLMEHPLMRYFPRQQDIPRAAVGEEFAPRSLWPPEEFEKAWDIIKQPEHDGDPDNWTEIQQWARDMGLERLTREADAALRALVDARERRENLIPGERVPHGPSIEETQLAYDEAMEQLEEAAGMQHRTEAQQQIQQLRREAQEAANAVARHDPDDDGTPGFILMERHREAMQRLDDARREAGSATGFDDDTEAGSTPEEDAAGTRSVSLDYLNTELEEALLTYLNTPTSGYDRSNHSLIWEQDTLREMVERYVKLIPDSEKERYHYAITPSSVFYQPDAREEILMEFTAGVEDFIRERDRTILAETSARVKPDHNSYSEENEQHLRMAQESHDFYDELRQVRREWHGARENRPPTRIVTPEEEALDMMEDSIAWVRRAEEAGWPIHRPSHQVRHRGGFYSNFKYPANELDSSIDFARNTGIDEDGMRLWLPDSVTEAHDHAEGGAAAALLESPPMDWEPRTRLLPGEPWVRRPPETQYQGEALGNEIAEEEVAMNTMRRGWLNDIRNPPPVPPSEFDWEFAEGRLRRRGEDE